MSFRTTFSIVVIAVFGSANWGGAADKIRFATEVQPLFAQRCLECHGPDKQKGGLRLDRLDSLLKEQKSGASAVVPGDLDKSEIIRRITSEDPDEVMPPKGGALSADEIGKLKDWVASGAAFERHWAYLPLVGGTLPVVKDKQWGRNPIDRFVLARLEKEDIKPSPRAAPHILIKRLYYDLIGLPPSPAEVDAFVSDESSGAYAALVKRLLASEHFGERWGRHWLDKARYADSDGYEKDNPRPNAWHYRSWVLKAVNADMPMDQFAIEQIAGDLLPEASPRQRLATAFHRQTLTNTEGGADQEEFRNAALFDRTETIGTIWLGLTLSCARCHTHKYDAIPQSDYYRLFAFFNNADETNYDLPILGPPFEKYKEQKATIEAELKLIGEAIEEAKAKHVDAFEKWQARLRERFAQENAPAFHDLAEMEVTSDIEGVGFEVEESGVVQVSGANPDGMMTFEIMGKIGAIDEPVTGIRLDALTDKRLPANGPGRAPNGNFVLNEVELVRGNTRLEFGGAKATHSQANFDVSKLIDGSRDKTSGWAVAPQLGKPHHAILNLKEPLEVEDGTSLTVRLVRNYDGEHTVGRFRIRLMTGEDVEAVAPEPIRDLLALRPEERDDKQKEALLDHFLRNVHEETKALFAKRDEARKKMPKSPSARVRVVAERASPRTTKVLDRGEFLKPTGVEVKPGGLAVLPPIEGREEGKLDRLDFANWLVSQDNPLPPRVLANHLWDKLFGEGLVRTMNDFGVRGERPVHPELLDWLAADYRRQGWSRKKMIETIVTSATYQQASAHREELREIDPTNKLLARQNRFRVEAEIVRDLCLSVSGLLSDEFGGPSVFPPLPAGVAALSYSNRFKWKTSEGEERYRRGLYTFFKRTAPHPNLITFDCPDSNTTNVRRRTSNTPLQALTMLNNEVFVEASRAFARRLLEMEAASDDQRMQQALRFCIGREPAEAETARFVDLLENGRRYYRAHPESGKKLIGNYLPNGVAAPEAAAWVAVARTALNLDEFMTRE